MKKHVYQFNEYINKHKLLQDIYPLIDAEEGITDTYNKVIEYLNIDSNSLKNAKMSVEIFDQKKEYRKLFIIFQFR